MEMFEGIRCLNGISQYTPVLFSFGILHIDVWPWPRSLQFSVSIVEQEKKQVLILEMG